MILVSSDLSHFLDYRAAVKIDAQTSRAILDLNPVPLTYQHACGQIAVRGLLQVARLKKLEAKQLQVKNSGDVVGKKDQVVGYGSYGFYQPKQRINRRQRAELTRIAWASIDHGLRFGKSSTPSMKGYSGIFIEPGASFVTLSDSNDKLRGCIGSLTSQTPLLVNVSHNAWKSAFVDGRFKPLTFEERKSLRLEVSVLGAPEQIVGESEEEIVSQIRPFIDGLIFKDGSRRGTFLPSVWKTLPNTNDYFRALKTKGGFASNYWSETVEVFRYTTETW